MSYCENRTRLLASVGETVAKKLLPAPFSLWYSDHSTGIQMTIVAVGHATRIVWRGSVWYHARYEFNDEEHIPGLQPDFKFAKAAIDKYFEDIKAVFDASLKKDAEDYQRELAAAEERRRQDLEAVRLALDTARAAGIAS